MAQHTNIKLLPLIPIRLYLAILVSDLSNHAALKSAPGTHLGVPAHQRTHHHRVLLYLRIFQYDSIGYTATCPDLCLGSNGDIRSKDGRVMDLCCGMY